VERLGAALERLPYADLRPLGRRLRECREQCRRQPHQAQAQDPALASRIARLALRVDDALAQVARRAAAVPGIHYPPELPITARVEEIRAHLEKYQILVVCGETGSGKSTQLPKLCLAAGRGIRGRIGHTQPRRLAAWTVATRVAAELGGEVGGIVGYKVRFQDRVGPDTAIKLMTDGVILNEIHADPDLLAYDTLIIDEAHERSLNVDFLLGYLKALLPRRPELKLIITSATIDPQRFSDHFGGAPIIEVSGRTYPVEVRYRPLADLAAADPDAAADVDEGGDPEQGLEAGVVAAVAELSRHGRGDILVFLPGEREIREVAEVLRKQRLPATEILPLFSRLAEADQRRIFSPHGGRHIVLATNVAETSVTVPGVHYVVDSGLARMSHYSPRLKVQRLPIKPISQAAANQRAGRCGRVASGICIRLYAALDFEQRPAFTDPEVLRTNLAAVILRLESLEFGHVDDFPFLDPPEGRYINDGYKLLEELGAVDADRALTPLGSQLARMPVDPRIARMLVAAGAEGCLKECLIVAAALSVQDPRERPYGQQGEADAAHRRFNDSKSDFLWYLKLWNFIQEERAKGLTRNQQARLLKSLYLGPARVREWLDVHNDLAAVAREIRLPMNAEPASYAAIHRALATGLLGYLGMKLETREYQGARGVKFFPFPGSGLAQKPPKWVMAGELVETSRLFGRTLAEIDPAWIAEIAGHLVRRSHSDPHWEKTSGRVMALEKQTLYGLILSAGKKVDYAQIVPQEAREIFIRRALVEGDSDTKAPFFLHNQSLRQEIEGLEHRERRRDLLVADEDLYAFYDARLPAECHSQAALTRWWREAEKENPRLLFLTQADLLREHDALDGEALRPSRIRLGGMDLALEYRFVPGSQADGVTVLCPLPALGKLVAEECEWPVPGMLLEKVTALLKSLPKPLRRHVVPVPEFAKAAVAALAALASGRIAGQGAGPAKDGQPVRRGLRAALAAEVERMIGAQVSAEDFRLDLLPEHLQLNFRLVDEGGAVVAEGRDLDALRERHAGQARASFARLASTDTQEKEWARAGIVRWDFGRLPERVEIRRGGVELPAYPALVDGGESVAIRCYETRAEALAHHPEGVLRLMILATPDQARHLAKSLPGMQRLGLRYMPFGRVESLRLDLLRAAYGEAFLPAAAEVRAEDELARVLTGGRARIVPAGTEIAAAVGEALEQAEALRLRLKGGGGRLTPRACVEVEAQLRGYFAEGFLLGTPLERLRHYPRYLKAVGIRLDRLALDPGKDAVKSAKVLPWVRRLEALTERWAPAAPEARPAPERRAALEALRGALEEYRISVFAQEMKTLEPVSEARLAKRFAELGG
jgi:ATP-dependent helicase HrpA